MLNEKGAESLLGKGDLPDPIRLQPPFLSPEERKAIFGA